MLNASTQHVGLNEPQARVPNKTITVYKIWEAHVVIHKSPGSNQKLLKTSISVVSTGSHYVLYLPFNMQPLSCGTRPTERLWNDLRGPLTIRYRIYNLNWPPFKFQTGSTQRFKISFLLVAINCSKVDIKETVALHLH